MGTCRDDPGKATVSQGRPGALIAGSGLMEGGRVGQVVTASNEGKASVSQPRGGVRRSWLRNEASRSPGCNRGR